MISLLENVSKVKLIAYSGMLMFIRLRMNASNNGGAVLVLESLIWLYSNLVDPASSHTLVSKIKPCM